MTSPDLSKATRDRNAEICRLYKEGQTMDQLAAQFVLSRQSIRNIARKAGVWRKQEPRPAFIGIDVTEETKAKLKVEADKQGKSVSRLVSDVLEDELNTTGAAK